MSDPTLEQWARRFYVFHLSPAKREEYRRGLASLRLAMAKYDRLLVELFSHPDFIPSEHIVELDRIAASKKETLSSLRRLEAALKPRK